jgi:hypothetical protein
MFTDGNNCQYDMRNVGSQPFNKGEPVIVVRQRIQGLIQILEVNVVE